MDSLPFAEIRRIKKSLGPKAEAISYDEFSQLLNNATRSNIADQGLGNAFETGVKVYSAATDEFLDTHAGGVNEALGNAGAKLFETFKQNPEIGRQVGEQALRGVVDYVPAVAGMALAPVTGGVSAPIGLSATAAMSAANAYEKTDSTGQTLLAGALPFVGGPVTSAGARMGLGLAGKTLGQTALGKALGITGGETVEAVVRGAGGQAIPVQRLVAKSFADRVIGAASGEIALSQGTAVASSLINYKDTGEFENPFTLVEQLTGLLDPTLIFSAKELLSPSIISEKLTHVAAEQTRKSGAEYQEQRARLDQRPLEIRDENVGEIERIRTQRLREIQELPKKERKAALADLEITISEAYANSTSSDRESIGKLFERDVASVVEEARTNPVTDKVVGDDGSTAERVVLAEDVEDPEIAAALKAAGFDDNEIVRAARVEKVDEPTNQAELQVMVEDANVVLDAVGQPLVDNAEIQETINDALEEGKTTEEAAVIVGEKLKTRVKKAKAAGRVIDPTLRHSKTMADKNKAGLGAMNSETAGRKRKELDDPSYASKHKFLSDMAELAKTDVIARAEMDVINKTLSKPVKGVTKDKQYINIISRYQKFIELKDAGKLTVRENGKDVPARLDQYLKVLNDMLYVTVKLGAEKLPMARIKRDGYPGLNHYYESQKAAQDAAARMELADPELVAEAYGVTNKKTGIREYGVQWRKKNTSVEAAEAAQAESYTAEALTPAAEKDVHTKQAEKTKLEKVQELLLDLQTSDAEMDQDDFDRLANALRVNPDAVAAVIHKVIKRKGLNIKLDDANEYSGYLYNKAQQRAANTRGFDEAVDAEYLKAAAAGNLEVAQRMVNEAAGGIEVFHGGDLQGDVIDTKYFSSGLSDSLERSIPVASPKELFAGVLEQKGFTPEAVEISHEYAEKLFNMFGHDKTELFQLTGDDVRGAATIKGEAAQLFLGGKNLQGLTHGDAVRELTFVAGHEMGHLTERLYNEKQLPNAAHQKFTEFKAWIDRASAEDHQLALEIMFDMVPPELKASRVFDMARQATGVGKGEEVRANLMSAWAMSQMTKPDQVAMNLMPVPVRRGLEVVADIARSIYGAMSGVGNVLKNYKAQSNMRAHLRELNTMMREIKEAHKKSEEFTKELSGLTRLDSTEAYLDTVRFWSEDAQERDPNPVPIDQRSWMGKAFDNMVQTLPQLAATVPAFRGIASAMYNLQGGMKASMNNIASQLTGQLDSNGKPSFSTKEHKLDWERVKKPGANRMFSDWLRAQNAHAWQTESGKTRLGKSLSLKDLETAKPELYQRLMTAPKEDRIAVMNMVHRMGKAMETFQIQEATKLIDHGNKIIVRSFIASKRPALFKQAPVLADSLFEALRMMDTTNVSQQQTGSILLSKIASYFEPQEFQRIVELGRRGITEQESVLGELVGKSWWSSEIRTGKFFLPWREKDTVADDGTVIKGRTGGLGFDTMKAARAKADQLIREGHTPEKIQGVRRGQPHMVAEDAFHRRLEELDRRNRDEIGAMGFDEATTERLQSIMDYSQQFEKELKAQKLFRIGSKRALKPGREDLDMLQTQMAYFNSASRAMHKKIFNAELRYQLTNPDMQDPVVSARLPQLLSMVDNFLAPDTEVGRAITMTSASYMLGLNLSSGITEMGQAWFSFIPELTNQGMGFVEANKTILKAMSDVSKFTLRHTTDRASKKVLEALPGAKGHDNNAFWENKEYEGLMNYAAKHDAISVVHSSEVLDVDIGSNADLSGTYSKDPENQSALQKYGITPIKNYARMSLKFYQQFTEFNARVAIIAGYELAKKKGLKSEIERYEHAVSYAQLATFGGGKIARPNVLFSGRGAFRTVGQAAYSLQSYSFGMLSAMRRYAETGFLKSQYPGLTDADRARARKSLGVMVATQFAGAGMLGFPFMSAVIKAFEALTGQELERDMMLGLAGLLEDDEENGGDWADIIMHGAANAVLGKVLPGAPDISSRIALSGIYGVNSYDGFSPEAMLGPSASLVKNFVNGGIAVANGDFSKGLEDFAPVPFKKAINLVRNEGELKDKTGKLLVEADFGEKLAFAAGFTPDRIRKARTWERLDRQHEEHENKKIGEITAEIAKAYDANPASAQNALMQRAKEDARVKFLADSGDQEGAQIEMQRAYKREATRVADYLEKANMPNDPLRDVSSTKTAGAKALANSLGLESQPSEFERTMYKAQVLNSLGVEQPQIQRTLKRAQLIDQLLQQYPGLVKSQAAIMADRLLSSAPR